MAAVVGGLLAIGAIVAVVVTLLVTNSGSSDDSTDTAASSTTPSSLSDDSSTLTSPSDTYTYPSTPGTYPTVPPGGSTDSIAIRQALQNYVDAINSRDITRIRATVCSENRTQAKAPTREGNMVIDAVLAPTIDGNFAKARALVHLEAGSRRSEAEPADVRFLKENDQWLYCQGAEPDIGT
ncbi:hypothetical protein QSJ18_08220 [Gordonia sp. ABSL1-1]|uniref:Rv0361 family membrane protein n=1 Tax=Gordonia sp. ABSL1-1 TaxID=3053923 RepID=UPI0025731ECB|nr:hypothetical protein [Gordonia sp. ABSL1-1]MDL9936721.1 hypothetical protein [Gordonia sp. ABSL1-1]